MTVFRISSGVTTGYTLSSGDVLAVMSGGASLRSIIGSGAFDYVSSGGSASGDVVKRGGSAWLYSGSFDSGVTVSSGGFIGLFTVVSSGQTVVEPAPGVSTTYDLDGVRVLSGGTIDFLGAAVESGGTLSLAAGTETGSIDVASGGVLAGPGELGAVYSDVSSDAGLISGVTIGFLSSQLDGSAHEYLTVGSSGEIEAVKVNFANITLLSGASGRSIDFLPGGIPLLQFSGSHLEVDTGALVIDTRLGLGASATIEGRASGTTVLSSGTEIVVSGGLVSGTRVFRGGLEVLAAGGRALDTEVLSGGALRLDSAIVASGQRLGAGRTNVVDRVSGVDVELGAIVDVSDEVVLSGGILALHSAGVVSGGVVSAGGLISGPGDVEGLLEVDGSVVAAQVEGFLEVKGLASAVTVDNRLDYYAGMEVHAHGLAEAVSMGGGGLYVDALGKVSAATIGSAAIVEIAAHGVASGLIIEARSFPFFGGEQVEGSVYGSIIDSGASETVMSGGYANGTQVLSGGVELLSSGARAAHVTISSGGVVEFGIVASSGQTLSVPGSNTTATQQVDGVTLAPGGLAIVTSAVVDSDARLTLQQGSVVESLLVAPGGAVVGPGVLGISGQFGFGGDYGLVSGLEVGDSTGDLGTLAVESGGVAKSVALTAGDIVVYGDGTATNIQVSGGEESVTSGGIAEDTVVLSGGVLSVYSGGVVTAGLILDGGSASVSGVVGAGQTIALQGETAVLALADFPDFHALVSGLTDSGQKIDLVGFDAIGARATWSQSGGVGTLTVQAGSESVALSLVGAYVTSDFHVADDGHGGSYVFDQPKAASARAKRMAHAAAAFSVGHGVGQAVEAPMSRSAAVVLPAGPAGR